MADGVKGDEVMVDVEIGTVGLGEKGLIGSDGAVANGADGTPAAGRCCGPRLKRYGVPLLAILCIGGAVAVACVLLIPGARGDATPAPPAPHDASTQPMDAQQPAGVDSETLPPSDSRNSSTLPERDTVPAPDAPRPDSPFIPTLTPGGPQETDNLTYPMVTPEPVTLYPLTTATPPAPPPTTAAPTTAPPTTAPASTPAVEWGSTTAYTEECIADTAEHGYHCNADCMVNCELAGHSGGLLLEPASQSQAPYCSSLHILDRYGDSTCCCSDQVPLSEWSGVTVPCLGGITEPDDACEAWCKLKSEPLLPDTSIDCDPGGLFCLPFGITDPDGYMAIECSDSLLCDCDMMT